MAQLAHAIGVACEECVVSTWAPTARPSSGLRSNRRRAQRAIRRSRPRRLDITPAGCWWRTPRTIRRRRCCSIFCAVPGCSVWPGCVWTTRSIPRAWGRPASPGACPDLNETRLIRPLLRVPRATTLAYCAQFDLALVEDPSNPVARLHAQSGAPGPVAAARAVQSSHSHRSGQDRADHWPPTTWPHWTSRCTRRCSACGARRRGQVRSPAVPGAATRRATAAFTPRTEGVAGWTSRCSGPGLSKRCGWSLLQAFGLPGQSVSLTVWCRALFGDGRLHLAAGRPRSSAARCRRNPGTSWSRAYNANTREGPTTHGHEVAQK